MSFTRNDNAVFCDRTTYTIFAIFPLLMVGLGGFALSRRRAPSPVQVGQLVDVEFGDRCTRVGRE